LSQFKGFIAKIGTKEGTSARGKWTAYSFKVEKDDGSEYEDWVNFGFERPPFKEGDYIEFQADQNERGFLQYIKGTGKPIKNPPARASAKQSGNAVSGNPATGAGTGTAGSTAANAGADRQTQIVLQHSQEIAIRVVAVLLTNDALPMSEAKTKAGTAKRFNEIMAFVDKLTVKYHNDAATGRILTTVADSPIDTSPDGPIPPAATEKPKKAKPRVSDPEPEPEGDAIDSDEQDDDNVGVY